MKSLPMDLGRSRWFNHRCKSTGMIFLISDYGWDLCMGFRAYFFGVNTTLDLRGGGIRVTFLSPNPFKFNFKRVPVPIVILFSIYRIKTSNGNRSWSFELFISVKILIYVIVMNIYYDLYDYTPTNAIAYLSPERGRSGVETTSLVRLMALPIPLKLLERDFFLIL